MSRIYHVLLIPVAIAVLLIRRKEHGRRFILYCSTVAVFSAAEVVVAFSSSANLASDASVVQNLSDIGVVRFAENIIYYQLQVINSFFTGGSHWQGSGANVLSAIVLVIFIVWFAALLRKSKFDLACWIGGLGFISLGSIAINIYTAGSVAAVSFPYNYASPVNWGENVYQEADLHFSYAYVCLFFLLLTIIYCLSCRIRELSAVMMHNPLREEMKQLAGGMLALSLCVVASVNVKPRLGYYDTGIVVEWHSIYQVTNQKTFFAAVNTFYGAAPISLEQGTDEMMFGLNEDKELYEWREGLPVYELTAPFCVAEIGAVSRAEERPILSVTAKRALTNFNVRYVAILLDREGRELGRATQAQAERRLWLDFLFPQPITGVYSIRFELEDGNPAFVQDGLQVGYML